MLSPIGCCGFSLNGNQNHDLNREGFLGPCNSQNWDYDVIHFPPKHEMHEYPFVMLKIEMETPHFSMEKYIKDSIQRAGFSIASLYGNYLSTASWVGFGVGGGFHSPVHIFCLGKPHITKVSRWENSQIWQAYPTFFYRKIISLIQMSLPQI